MPRLLSGTTATNFIQDFSLNIYIVFNFLFKSADFYQQFNTIISV
jgi:hypothetical protein